MNMFNFVRAFSNCFLYAFQISRQQLELVKNMKQSGKSIQSRSLNRVLGNLEKIHVQPYNIFVKEEQKKLQEHWLVRCSQCYLFMPTCH